MNISKANIIAQLQKDILPLQGFKRTLNPMSLDVVPADIKISFPNAVFPLGAVHEFVSTSIEDVAATAGFISGMLAEIMRTGGATIWITSAATIFPPALKYFGISPDKIIFIDLKKEKEVLWVMEEALKCDALAAVVAEIPEISFMASRRLQLAVEQSQVTGFILRQNPRTSSTTACVTRWRITALPTELTGMPGIGYPRWNVELLKVRNGKPGEWPIEFTAGRFRHVTPLKTLPLKQQKKTG